MESVKAQVIAKDRVREWIGRLMAEAEVIAPVLAHGWDEVFAAIRSPDEVLWEFTNPLHPPKQFLLPQTDPVVAIQRGDNGYELEAIVDERRRILLNVRSCDVTGLAFLRRMHAADLPDDAYLRRAAAVTTICLACSQPCPLGFCICSSAGPFAREGFDVQLSDLGDRLLAEPGSDRGQELLAAAGSLFRPATSDELARRYELEEQARQRFGEQTCHFASAMRRISTGRVAEDLWASMGDWCLECGACNFVCPTCYCFNVTDDMALSMNEGTRTRHWDGCQLADFTLVGHGENFRDNAAARIRHRFHRKFKYHLDEVSEIFCTGCGRCWETCPSEINLVEIANALSAEEVE